MPVARGGTGYTTSPKAINGLIINSTAITAANVADGDYLVLSDTSASTGKKMLVSEAKKLFSGAKVAFGTYVGTGTYGVNNPISLTFDFEPKLLWVNWNARGGELFANAWTVSSGRIPLNFQFIVLRGASEVVLSKEGEVSKLFFSWNSENVSWYSNADEWAQLNLSSSTYTYFALG